MVSISDIKMKELIDITSGERLGYIYDFEIDVEKGIINAMIVPGNVKGFNFFSKPNDLIINWEDIVIVGQDTILIDLK